MGFWGNVRCGGCGQQVKLTRDKRLALEVCPRCYTPKGGQRPVPIAQGGPATLVHSYSVTRAHGRTREAFKDEAEALGRLGWRVSSQSESGNQLRLFVGYEPNNITATYTRDA